MTFHGPILVDRGVGRLGRSAATTFAALLAGSTQYRAVKYHENPPDRLLGAEPLS